MTTVVSIVPPESFNHAGDLPLRHDAADPRKTDFAGRSVVIDLRNCTFVRPAAALWCIVYGALVTQRNISCRLLVPNNTGVCLYLKSLGLFDTLKQHNVDVDDRDIFSRTDRKTILPITRFNTEGDASDVANEAFRKLQKTGLGAANLTRIVTESFGELTMNAVQHSESTIEAFGCIQFVDFESGPCFTCTVADGGIGVYESLCRNAEFGSRVFYDWDALELAVQERVSGTGDKNRGIGLFSVSEDIRGPGTSLLLHSGIGSLFLSEDESKEDELHGKGRRTRLFPGTLAYFSIPA